jgi:hypothetical protein
MGTKPTIIGALAGLAVADCVWAITSGRPSPLIAAAGFSAVAVVVGLHNEYRAGVAVGIAGAAIHAFELFFHGVRGLGRAEGVLFGANLCLSVVVAALSWRLLRGTRHAAGARPV